MSRSSTELKTKDIPEPASAQSVSRERFTGRWKTFEAAFRGLSEIAQYIGTLEGGLNDQRRMESELKIKNEELSQSEVGQRKMLKTFTKEYDDWRIQKAELARNLQLAREEINSLKTQVSKHTQDYISKESYCHKVIELEAVAARKENSAVKEKDVESRKLRKTADNLEKEVGKLKIESVENSVQLLGTKARLECCEAKLERVWDDIGLEDLSADLRTSLEESSVAMLYDGLAFSGHPIFLVNLTGRQVDIFEQLQRSGFMSEIRQTIPISNTETSKYLRMAVAESIIARRLAETLFQPLPIVDPSAKYLLTDALNSLYVKNPRQESILRSLLLTASTLQGDGERRRVLKAIVDEVIKILQPLLFDQARTEAFKKALEILILEAFDIWSLTQKNPEQILASIEGRNWDWNSYSEHDDVVSLPVEQQILFPQSGEPLMTLFPRIYARRGHAVFHRGFSLWSNQATVMAGALESKEQVARMPLPDRSNASGSRISSVHSPATNASFQQKIKKNSDSVNSSQDGQGGRRQKFK